MRNHGDSEGRRGNVDRLSKGVTASALVRKVDCRTSSTPGREM